MGVAFQTPPTLAEPFLLQWIFLFRRLSEKKKGISLEVIKNNFRNWHTSIWSTMWVWKFKALRAKDLVLSSNSSGEETTEYTSSAKFSTFLSTTFLIIHKHKWYILQIEFVSSYFISLFTSSQAALSYLLYSKISNQKSILIKPNYEKFDLFNVIIRLLIFTVKIYCENSYVSPFDLWYWLNFHTGEIKSLLSQVLFNMYLLLKFYYLVDDKQSWYSWLINFGCWFFWNCFLKYQKKKIYLLFWIFCSIS